MNFKSLIIRLFTFILPLLFASNIFAAGDIKVGETIFKGNCAQCHNKNMKDKDVFFAWAAAKGLDVAKVKAAYSGFAVDSKMRRGDPMVKTYAIESVPTVIVDGKFATAALKKGHAGMPEAIDFLVSKARKERKS